MRNLTEHSAGTVDWLIDMGADLSRITACFAHGTSDSSKIGTMLISTLENQVESLDIEVRVGNKGVHLIQEGGAVTGIKVETSEGNYIVVAKAVILTSGGFASSDEMLAKYMPSWVGYPSTACVGSTGDGIVMGLEVGAAIDKMEMASPNVVFIPNADQGTQSLTSVTSIRQSGAIMVNKNAQRFTNELKGTAALGNEVVKKSDGACCLIFDQKTSDNSDSVRSFFDAGYFTEAETLEALASMIELDAAELEATVDTYRGYCDAEEDKDFARATFQSRLDQAPYHAFPLTPVGLSTYGGLTIDLSSRVVDESGAPIPGLYAGGETTSQLGTGTSVAMFTVRLASTTAVEDMK